VRLPYIIDPAKPKDNGASSPDSADPAKPFRSSAGPRRHSSGAKGSIGLGLILAAL
jgi:hypothetical protein